ncbi:MAG: RluA family pseudouridine synthase [Bdellovibrionia bacterium]
MTFATRTLEIHSPGLRFDQVLLCELKLEYPCISRAWLKKQFQAGRIRIQTQVAKPSLLLNPGLLEVQLSNDLLDELKNLETPALKSWTPPPAQISILHEDDQLLILNKPEGLPSVPLDHSDTPTAVGLALTHCPALCSIGRSPFESGLVHRLDTGTSGLLAFAKTQDEYQRLRSIWKTGQVRKIYRAWVTGSEPFPPLPHPIQTPLAHSKKSSKKMIAWTPERAHQARGGALPTQTLIQSIEAQVSSGLTPERSARFDLQIQIQTGVRHQIRCHLSLLGYPILGDPVYAGKPASRLFLHAFELILPTAKGSLLALQAPLPNNWSNPDEVKPTALKS